VVIGKNAGNNATFGSYNIIMGYTNGQGALGAQNLFIGGLETGRYATSDYSVGIGSYALSNVTVDGSVGIGHKALQLNNKEVEKIEMDNYPDIIGQAQSMQEIFRIIGKLSQSNATILINGESGSGKELVANAIHKNSNRKSKGIRY